MSDLRYDVGRAASPVSEFDEIVESEKNATPTDGIGLCLSGGGYRAMLFHVGAILRLNEARLLPKLCRVSSVSGGSITAAVLGMNWRKLSFAAGISANLDELLVKPIRKLASQTIDCRSVLSGIFLPRSISQWLSRAYNKVLFHGTTLQDLPSDQEGPRFVINATSVQTGALARFSRPYVADYKVGIIENPRVRLSDAVAASSAFPPVLSPFTLKVQPASFAAHAHGPLYRKPYNEKLVLSDGGVYDNLGIETIWKRYALVLVSDGGGQLEPDGEPASDWARHSIRVMELIDSQVRNLRKRQIIGGFVSDTDLHKGTYWGIRSNIDHYGLTDALVCPQAATLALANMPTRLKKLPLETQNRLMNWGYAICDAALRKHFTRHLPDGLAPPTKFPFDHNIG